jgi:hypothetical protein
VRSWNFIWFLFGFICVDSNLNSNSIENRRRFNRKPLTPLSWAATAISAHFRFRPANTQQCPPAGASRARAAYRPAPPVSRHLIPFFFLLFPLLSFLSLTCGRRCGKGEAVRPCPPPRMASTRRELDRTVQPTYHRLYKSRRDRLPSNPSHSGISPQSRRR